VVGSETDFVDGVVDQVHLRVEHGVDMLEGEEVILAKGDVVGIVVERILGSGLDILGLFGLCFF